MGGGVGVAGGGAGGGGGGWGWGVKTHNSKPITGFTRSQDSWGLCQNREDFVFRGSNILRFRKSSRSPLYKIYVRST